MGAEENLRCTQCDTEEVGMNVERSREVRNAPVKEMVWECPNCGGFAYGYQHQRKGTVDAVNNAEFIEQ